MAYPTGLSGAAPGAISKPTGNAWSGGNAPGGINQTKKTTVITKKATPIAPSVPMINPKAPVETAVPIHVIPPVLLPGDITKDTKPIQIMPPVNPVLIGTGSGGGSAGSGGGGGSLYAGGDGGSDYTVEEGSGVSPLLLLGGAGLVLYFLTRRKR